MQMQEHRRKKQAGQALVETVLTLTAFVIMLPGIIEIGQILFIHQMLGERVRTAVRWGSVNAWDNATSPGLITNIVLYGTTVPAQWALPVFNLSAQNVAVTRPQPDYSAADRIVVKVSGYALTFMTNGVVQGSNGNANPSSQFNGLTIQETLPYEVSNGSSH
jgi:hypothetical protein